MTRPVLLDNTVLTNFALVGQTDLVTYLWGAAVSTTSAVMAEYQAGVAGGLLPPEAWAHLPVLTLTEE
jgi:predicted nucleic acid-binding protein